MYKDEGWIATKDVLIRLKKKLLTRVKDERVEEYESYFKKKLFFLKMCIFLLTK